MSLTDYDCILHSYYFMAQTLGTDSLGHLNLMTAFFFIFLQFYMSSAHFPWDNNTCLLFTSWQHCDGSGFMMRLNGPLCHGLSVCP